jgi:LDH2 family malate/lactate/ureidoglycolate dehydrogenase
MLLGREELGQAVSAYTAFLRQSTPLDPHLPVLAPGDPELKHGEVTTQNGIVITAPIKKGLDNLARLLGCDSLQ